MEENAKQKLASIFQKTSVIDKEDYDTQVLNTINSVLEKKNADFRLNKQDGQINIRKEPIH